MKDPPLVFDTSYRTGLASGEIVESGEPDPAHLTHHIKGGTMDTRNKTQIVTDLIFIILYGIAGLIPMLPLLFIK